MNDKNPKTEQAKLVKAFARHLRIAPRKLRLVTNAVKGMYVDQALAQLKHMNKKGALMVAKAIDSAVANARNNFSLNPEHLYIQSITTDMGKVMGRYFPRARGSAFVIRRKLSHLNVVLAEKKRKGSKTARAGFLKRFSATEDAKDDKKAVSVEAQDAVAKEPKSEAKRQRTIKTSEQKKMNTVQQKRRLFNRKAGE